MVAAGQTHATGLTVRLGEVEDLSISVAIAPYISVLALLTEAVGGLDRGLPAGWRNAVAGAVGPSGRAAVRPMTTGTCVAPDSVLPIAPRADVAMTTTLEALRASGDNSVSRDLHTEFGTELPSNWRGPGASPRRWVMDLADACEAVATLIAPLWGRVAPLLDREVERLGVAAVHGATDVLLNSLGPRMTCTDGVLRYSHPSSGDIALGGRKIALVPMLAGTRMLLTHFDDPDLVWIGYPVPGLGDVWEAGTKPVAETDRMTLVLGYHRAAILRFLSRPAAMREIAAQLQCAPNTVTFHCDRLELAGLISRTRHGRSVRVARTARAAELLDVMAD